MVQNLLEARYPFLRNDVFLIAQVNAETGKQTLRMEKIDPYSGKTLIEDELDCIHTVVFDIPLSDLTELIDKPEFPEELILIRSSEQLNQIHLSPEEKFIAFRSWVGGIAEEGMQAFEIQEDIETVTHLLYPITSSLLRFLARVDTCFIIKYLEYIDRKAAYEGIRHNTYLIACLLPIIEGLVKKPKIPTGSEVLEIILTLSPPIELFNKNWNLFRQLAETYENFLWQYLKLVQGEYTKKHSNQDEWLSRTLLPMVFALVWVNDSYDAKQRDLFRQILELNPPLEIFSGYTALFRYFIRNDPNFLPYYMKRVKLDNANSRAGDVIWLTSVLRPVFIGFDYVNESGTFNAVNLWRDILVLNPPLKLILDNWSTVQNVTQKYPNILQEYVKFVNRLLLFNPQFRNRDWLEMAFRPVWKVLHYNTSDENLSFPGEIRNARQYIRKSQDQDNCQDCLMITFCQLVCEIDQHNRKARDFDSCP